MATTRQPIIWCGMPAQKYSLPSGLGKEVMSWKFLSKSRLKKMFKEWRKFGIKYFSVIYIEKNEEDGLIDEARFGINVLEYPDMVVSMLGECADYHGIVKVHNFASQHEAGIVVKQTFNPEELNIDDKLIDAILRARAKYDEEQARKRP